MKPRAIIITGYGINCEEETAYGFTLAGGEAKIVHINDLIEKNEKLSNYQILAIPGGFAYGDDTGAGKAFANRIRNHLIQHVLKFIAEDRLIIGICNGFQVIAQLGLVPGFNGTYDKPCVALNRNAQALYNCRWVDLEVQKNVKTPWLKDITRFSIPIGHGEGNFYAPPKILQKLKTKNLIALKYVKGEMCEFLNLPANPNGSLEDIAGITDETGRILGLMPHPDRALFITNRPDWTSKKEIARRSGKKLPKEGPGVQIFRNAIQYFNGNLSSHSASFPI